MKNSEFNQTMAATNTLQLEALRTHGQGAWLSETPRLRTAGRYPKTSLERLQFKFWYWWLRSCCPPDWSDTELSEALGLDARSRTIDRMRRLGLAPRVIWARSAPPTVVAEPEFALIEKVAANPRFSGARGVLEAPFWTLFGRQIVGRKLKGNPHPGTTANLRNVRLMLNRFMQERNLLRLEGDTNSIVDEQIGLLVRHSGINDSSRSSARLYTQWLNAALSRMNGPFERLTLSGLLLRESILLGMVEQAYLLIKIFKQEIARAVPPVACKSAIKRKLYEEFVDEFQDVVLAYVQRGHLDTSQENGFYPDGTENAVQGYVLSRESGFLRNDLDQAREEWERHLLPDRLLVDAFIGVGLHSQFSPPMDDAAIAEEIEAHRQLREIEGAVEWREPDSKWL